VTPVISTVLEWVILPAIMFAIFAFAWVIASTARSAELNVSSWAGFWAGLVTFVIYVVSELGRIREPNLHFSALPGLLLRPLGWGLGAGFAFLWLVRDVVPTRLVGLITLMLAASSTPAMFTYIFIDSSGSRSCIGRSARRWESCCTSWRSPPPSSTFSSRAPGWGRIRLVTTLNYHSTFSHRRTEGVRRWSG
jgi:hypothetical protein